MLLLESWMKDNYYFYTISNDNQLDYSVRYSESALIAKP
jgi:hypothetical protein